MSQQRPMNWFVRSSGFGKSLSVDFVRKDPAKPKSLVKRYFEDAYEEEFDPAAGRPHEPEHSRHRLKALHSVTDLGQLLDVLEELAGLPSPMPVLPPPRRRSGRLMLVPPPSAASSRASASS